jgi:hypothetical protein
MSQLCQLGNHVGIEPVVQVDNVGHVGVTKALDPSQNGIKRGF